MNSLTDLSDGEIWELFIENDIINSIIRNDEFKDIPKQRSKKVVDLINKQKDLVHETKSEEELLREEMRRRAKNFEDEIKGKNLDELRQYAIDVEWFNYDENLTEADLKRMLVEEYTILLGATGIDSIISRLKSHETTSTGNSGFAGKVKNMVKDNPLKTTAALGSTFGAGALLGSSLSGGKRRRRSRRRSRRRQSRKEKSTKRR
jgi:hypothetical protein